MLGLIWFGAAVSLAEILTGTFFAPLGFEQGLIAIALGHVIGGVLFFAVSYVELTPRTHLPLGSPTALIAVFGITQSPGFHNRENGGLS